MTGFLALLAYAEDPPPDVSPGEPAPSPVPWAMQPGDTPPAYPPMPSANPAPPPFPGDPTAEAAAARGVAGVAISQAGAPLSGLYVFAGDAEATTDTEGKFF